MNTQAQMHVMEVVLTSVLFISAMNVAVEVLPSYSSDPSGAVQLELLGRDVLEVADNLPPANGSVALAYGNSSLKAWVFGGGLEELSGYLNVTLPEAVAYKVLLGPADEPSATLLEHSLPLEGVVVVERVLYQEGQLYELRLWLWFGPRGVGL